MTATRDAVRDTRDQFAFHDVVFTFDRMLNDSNPWHKVTGASGFPHAQSMGLPKLIKSISKVDDNTVKFELNAPDATFVSILTMGFASIYSAEYADQLLKAGKQVDLNSKPIGTGPFMWDKRVVGQSVTFKRNPYYWQKGKPYLDSVTWKFVTDENTRELQLRGGQIQVDCSSQAPTGWPEKRWVCVEWQFDGSKDELHHWFDGKPLTDIDIIQKGKYCTNGAGGTPWHSPSFSALILGWAHYQTSPIPIEMWMDDLVISSQRIGCPPAPAATP